MEPHLRDLLKLEVELSIEIIHSLHLMGSLAIDASVVASSKIASWRASDRVPSGDPGSRGLSSKGFGNDVDGAADLNASPVVPVIVDGAFQASATRAETPQTPRTAATYAAYAVAESMAWRSMVAGE